MFNKDNTLVQGRRNLYLMSDLYWDTVDKRHPATKNRPSRPYYPLINQGMPIVNMAGKMIEFVLQHYERRINITINV